MGDLIKQFFGGIVKCVGKFGRERVNNHYHIYQFNTGRQTQKANEACMSCLPVAKGTQTSGTNEVQPYAKAQDVLSWIHYVGTA